MSMPHHLYPVAVLFHVGDITEALPSPRDLWAAKYWTWELTITLPLLVWAAWYLIGSVRRGQQAGPRWRHGAFWIGWFALTTALVSPLHQLGDVLFSAHMVQHEILILIAAPLIAVSHASVTLLYALPRAWRRTVGGMLSRIEHHPVVATITGPLASWILHAVALWGWHLPFLYQATVTSDVVHAFQHLSFFVTGIVFWSALYGAGCSSMGYGTGTLYTFGTAVHCSALGALLTFSTVVWYPIYTERTAAWHLTPLQDQQLGGLLMWVPSGVVFIAIGIALFARWLGSAETRHAHTSMHSATLRKAR